VGVMIPLPKRVKPWCLNKEKCEELLILFEKNADAVQSRRDQSGNKSGARGTRSQVSSSLARLAYTISVKEHRRNVIFFCYSTILPGSTTTNSCRILQGSKFPLMTDNKPWLTCIDAPKHDLV